MRDERILHDDVVTARTFQARDTPSIDDRHVVAREQEGAGTCPPFHGGRKDST